MRLYVNSNAIDDKAIQYLDNWRQKTKSCICCRHQVIRFVFFCTKNNDRLDVCAEEVVKESYVWERKRMFDNNERYGLNWADRWCALSDRNETRQKDLMAYVWCNWFYHFKQNIGCNTSLLFRIHPETNDVNIPIIVIDEYIWVLHYLYC